MEQDEVVGRAFLRSVVAELHRIKERADKAMAQLRDEAQLYWAPGGESNSIDVIVRHLSENMLSRWTGIFATEGEKPGRSRGAGLEPAGQVTWEKLLLEWEKGWQCLFNTVSALAPADLGRTITVRGEALSVMEAILRQHSHYASHVGQIAYLAKHLTGGGLQLSFPLGRPNRP